MAPHPEAPGKYPCSPHNSLILLLCSAALNLWGRSKWGLCYHKTYPKSRSLSLFLNW